MCGSILPFLKLDSNTRKQKNKTKQNKQKSPQAVCISKTLMKGRILEPNSINFKTPECVLFPSTPLSLNSYYAACIEMDSFLKE